MERKFPSFLAHTPGPALCDIVHFCVLLSDLIDEVATKCSVPRALILPLQRSKILQGPGSLGDWGIEQDMTLSLSALGFLVSGIVPGAIVADAGTQNHGAGDCVETKTTRKPKRKTTSRVWEAVEVSGDSRDAEIARGSGTQPM